jgi:hypothetical protein
MFAKNKVFGYPIETVVLSVLNNEVNAMTAALKLLTQKHPVQKQFNPTSPHVMESV